MPISNSTSDANLRIKQAPSHSLSSLVSPEVNQYEVDQDNQELEPDSSPNYNPKTSRGHNKIESPNYSDRVR